MRTYQLRPWRGRAEAAAAAASGGGGNAITEEDLVCEEMPSVETLVTQLAQAQATIVELEQQIKTGEEANSLAWGKMSQMVCNLKQVAQATIAKLEAN
ncbi:hypothetical protein V6N13_122055 [Hibiscus sabdariffa]|uniref:Uncharacterized protein n=1 Tax=Hibiscus sabdariffa TaxID=183260 RepID=A0ABR2C6Q0_9ROSI